MVAGVAVIEGEFRQPASTRETRRVQKGHVPQCRLQLTRAPYVEAAWRAFNFAEKYQCPVFILTDTYLASALRTFPLDALDPSDVTIDRGKLIEIGEPFETADGRYERFQITADGVSPRALPGNPATIHSVTSDEHTPAGHISEEAEDRVPMMDKRMRKLAVAATEMRPPRLHGPEEADITLVCWGSTYMICREAVELARSAGASLNLLQFADLWPFPANAASISFRLNRLVR